jgi:hypothetical protein
MRLRNVLATVALGSALTVGLTVPAQAAEAAVPVPVKSVQGDAPAPTAASGWYIYDTYFWLSDCRDKGRQGLSNGWWRSYDCKNGSASPFDDYELWVLV